MGTTQPTTHECAHCGATDVGSYGAGYASLTTIGPPRHHTVYLCHPNDPGRPRCYALVILHKHQMPCQSCIRHLRR